MGSLEQAYNKSMDAIRTDPANPKFYRVAGFVLVTLAKQLHSVDYARLALDNFCAARELQPDALNVRNYMNARKLLYLLTEQIGLENKQILMGYLSKFYQNTQELEGFFRKFDGEVKHVIPKEFQCAISLVS